MTGSVVVGIDGSEVAGAALELAADEAHLRKSRLVVAYAGRASAPADDQVRPIGEILGREAIAKVAAMHPHVDCDFVQREADAADMLIEMSAAADVLVVGTHRTGRLRGWVLGSVSQRVAARASCPVITVSGPQEHVSAPVVLGVSGTPGGMAALRFACEEARLRDVPLHAVRSAITDDWAFVRRGEAMGFGAEVLQDAAQIELDKAIGAAKEQYPEVSINGEVSQLHPFGALLKASEGAGLLVIGSRRSRTASLPHLGPVAAWVLHQATCPLAVVGFRTD